MASAAFWDSLCLEHGGLSHAVVHEAGHAVVAVILGYEFIDVCVHFAPWEHEGLKHNLEGGGVRFASGEALRKIVEANPRGSLQMCLAGAQAEKAAYGHTLEGSSASDAQLWIGHSGLLGDAAEEKITAFIGEPYVEVCRAGNAIVRTHIGAVLEVARELGESEDMKLSFAQVRRFVDAV
jgi:hypothetical protein